jgi:hypothetical protein
MPGLKKKFVQFSLNPGNLELHLKLGRSFFNGSSTVIKFSGVLFTQKDGLKIKVMLRKCKSFYLPISKA